MAVDQRRPCLGLRQTGGNRELLCEETAWTRRVDEEPGPHLERLSVASPAKPHGILCKVDRSQLRSIEIIHTRGNGLPHEMMIEVGAQPVRVRQRVVRAGGD